MLNVFQFALGLRRILDVCEKNALSIRDNQSPRMQMQAMLAEEEQETSRKENTEAGKSPLPLARRRGQRRRRAKRPSLTDSDDVILAPKQYLG